MSNKIIRMRQQVKLSERTLSNVDSVCWCGGWVWRGVTGMIRGAR